MRVASLVYAAFAAITAVHAQCAPGLQEVSLLGSGTVYCVNGDPCSGYYSGNDNVGKFSCPQQGQPNIDGSQTLKDGTCCGITPGGNLGCIYNKPGAQCKGPLPSPYVPPSTTATPTTTSAVTPAPTTTSAVTPVPTTTASATPSVTTLDPSKTTTVAPNASTTVAPNATTLSPNATTLAPNATTLSPNATTVSPNGTTPNNGTVTTQSPDQIGTSAPSSPRPTGTLSTDKSPNSDNSDSSKIGTGAIVGIIIGVIALVLLVALFVFKKKRSPSESYMPSPPMEAAGMASSAAAAGALMEVDEVLTPRQNVTLL
ncbi:Aste57867_24879 [Aphanomyces stellatus]|uniref:Aste57867_24879 protein n=1 Tax=Aphanomyces stellatus TaxID=120398 RepID=A0A485LT18_9STRA|nr:hypothetical protein As57867_024801 [Aphanomyces stellatus]VFU01513.1 Aste57867_24879 [Aphanomyces stellatus]